MEMFPVITRNIETNYLWRCGAHPHTNRVQDVVLEVGNVSCHHQEC